jgi:G3E family GTPase
MDKMHFLMNIDPMHRPGFMNLYSRGQIGTKVEDGQRYVRLQKPSDEVEFGRELSTGREKEFGWQEYDNEKFPRIAAPIAKEHFERHGYDTEAESQDGWRSITAKNSGSSHQREFYTVINDFEEEEDKFRAYLFSKTPAWADNPEDFVYPEKQFDHEGNITGGRQKYVHEMASDRLNAFEERTTDALEEYKPETVDDFYLKLIDEY